MRAWLEIDLAKLERNFATVSRHIGQDRGVIAVVKSDAYGHGIDRISRELCKHGVAGFAVITLAEGKAIRSHSELPILVMGYLDDDEIAEAIAANMTLSLYDEGLASLYDEVAARLGMIARVQLKVETGLNRLGVQPEDARRLLHEWDRYPNLALDGIYSHLASSQDRAIDLEQSEALHRFLTEVPPARRAVPIHLCNSHGLQPFPEGWHNAVRIGLALYGVEEVLPGLEPTLECRTVVMQRKRVKRGEGVSYNKLFRAPRDMDVAVLSIGYAEGLSQALTGRMDVLINGYRTQVIGQICMNLCTIDVEGIPAQRGDVVTVIGSQLGADGRQLSIKVTDMARAANIRHHEIITRLGLSLPKVYRPTTATAAVDAKATMLPS